MKRIVFIKSGWGEAQCPANPAYPHGIEIAPANTKPSDELCQIRLPYPAPEIGMWSVYCDECQVSILITAAGRADDPISVFLPCDMKEKYAKDE